jgi:hypothetical protein
LFTNGLLQLGHALNGALQTGFTGLLGLSKVFNSLAKVKNGSASFIVFKDPSVKIAVDACQQQP